jgi:hypothetical protein
MPQNFHGRGVNEADFDGVCASRGHQAEFQVCDPCIDPGSDPFVTNEALKPEPDKPVEQLHPHEIRTYALRYRSFKSTTAERRGVKDLE